MRNCPFCAEEIQDAAVICKHCQSDLTRRPDRATSGPAEPAAPPPIPHVPILVMIVFTICSIGFYVPTWFLLRRSVLRSLNTAQVVDAWPPLLSLCCSLVYFAVALDNAGDAGPLGSLVTLVGSCALVYQSLKTKDVIEDHLTSPDGSPAGILGESQRLSGFMTVCFGPFYLQHVLNTRVLMATSTGDSDGGESIGLGLR